jgi:hypothetical protein
LGGGTLAIASLANILPAQEPNQTILRARDYGARGDGRTDDGPAIRNMLQAARRIQGHVTLIFEPNRCYHVTTGEASYVFNLTDRESLTIDGQGSEFLVDAQLRFIRLIRSKDITVQNLKVDYSPLPFAEAAIIGTNAARGTVDVRIREGFDTPPLGGPTNKDDEQAFFGMLWHKGPYSLLGEHFWIKDIREASQGSVKQRTLRLKNDPKHPAPIDKINPAEWSMSVPVRGVAHRVGPGHNCLLQENHDLHFKNIEFWSAPWFVFGIFGNKGQLTFDRTHIRPKPHTNRITSSWRDGFHVKHNTADLLWDSCILEGMNDDAFNISGHTSTVQEVHSSRRIRTHQNYPLRVQPMRSGDVLNFYDPKNDVLLGTRVIKSVQGTQNDRHANPWTIDLNKPIAGLSNHRTLVWNASVTNPNTVIRRCRIYKSCRFRSSVTLENCDITAFVWFTGDKIETPIPSDVVIKNCRLRLGRGNANWAVRFATPVDHGPAPENAGEDQLPIHNVLMSGNDIYGGLSLASVSDVTLEDNRFHRDDSPISFRRVQRVLLRDNVTSKGSLTELNQLTVPARVDRREITIDNKQEGQLRSLMKPFAHWYMVHPHAMRIRFHKLALSGHAPHDAGLIEWDGKRVRCYHIDLHALAPSDKVLFLHENAAPNSRTLVFDTYIPKDPEVNIECRVDFSQATDRGRGNRWYRKHLRPGQWQRHRLRLPDGRGEAQPQRVRIGVTGDGEPPPGAQLYLGGVHLLP